LITVQPLVTVKRVPWLGQGELGWGLVLVASGPSTAVEPA